MTTLYYSTYKNIITLIIVACLAQNASAKVETDISSALSDYTATIQERQKSSQERQKSSSTHVISSYVDRIKTYSVNVEDIINSDNTTNVNNVPTLVQLYKAALIKSPELALAETNQKIAKSEVDLAHHSWLPNISANMSHSYTRKVGAYADTSVRSRRLNDNGQIGVRVTQPLFNPSFNLDISQAKLNETANQYAIKQTRNELINRVVTIFFDILASQSELNLIDSQLSFVSEQHKKTITTYKAGMVSITDVREAEAKYDSLKAQRKALYWQIKSKQAEMVSLTGLTVNPNSYHNSIHNLPDITSSDEIDYWVNAFLENNEEIKKAELEYKISNIDTKKNHYQNYPTAQAVMEHKYNTRPWTQRGHKDYSENKSDWSIKIEVEVPLFSKTSSQAQQNKTVELANQKYYNLLTTREKLIIELQKSYYQVLASKSQVLGLETTVQSAEIALQANQLAYLVGMRVNVDVLESQTKLHEAKKQQLISWYDSWKSFIRLNQISGTLNENQLYEIDNALKKSPDSSDQDLLKYDENIVPTSKIVNEEVQEINADLEDVRRMISDIESSITEKSGSL